MELRTCPFFSSNFGNLLHTRSELEIKTGLFSNSCQQGLSGIYFQNKENQLLKWVYMKGNCV